VFENGNLQKKIQPYTTDKFKLFNCANIGAGTGLEPGSYDLDKKNNPLYQRTEQ
jgi:hypothetical protein